MAKQRDIDGDRRDNKRWWWCSVQQCWHVSRLLPEREEAEQRCRCSGSKTSLPSRSLPLNWTGELRVVAQLHGSQTHVYSGLGKTKKKRVWLQRGWSHSVNMDQQSSDSLRSSASEPDVTVSLCDKHPLHVTPRPNTPFPPSTQSGRMINQMQVESGSSSPESNSQGEGEVERSRARGWDSGILHAPKTSASSVNTREEKAVFESKSIAVKKKESKRSVHSGLSVVTV